MKTGVASAPFSASQQSPDAGSGGGSGNVAGRQARAQEGPDMGGLLAGEERSWEEEAEKAEAEADAVLGFVKIVVCVCVCVCMCV